MEVDEHYPFRERNDLQDAIVARETSRIDLLVKSLIDALTEFSKGDVLVCRVRIRELLFMIIDALIFLVGMSLN